MLVNIGFGNMVNRERVITVVNPDTAPIKRLIQDAKDGGRAIDVTCGKRTKSVILTDSDHVILSALQCETLAGRFADKEEKNKKTEQGRLIIISGPSGSGKSTVLKELFKITDYKYSVSATTREARKGETDGVNYHFITEENFLTKVSNGEMLEYFEYAGNYYGTLKAPLEKMLGEGHTVALEIEVNGAAAVKKIYPGAVMIFLSPTTFDELEKRLRGRKTETEESINNRLETAKKEIERIYEYDYLVLNGADMQQTAAYNIKCIVDFDQKTEEESAITPKKAEKFIENYYL